MKHSNQLSHRHNLSQYNTFKVFEKLYDNVSAKELEEIEVPPPSTHNYRLLKILSILLIIIFISLSLHSCLSYFLKTPYPLIIISDNNLSPLLKQGDVILSKGIITPQQIKPGDLVVFYYLIDDQKIFSVRQVKTTNQTQFILTDLRKKKLIQSVDNKYIVGQVIGGQHPWRLPLIGKLSLLWARIK